MFLDANRPWRKVKVTARRTAIDFAVCMRELADLHYPKAERIRVVLDNLPTHSAGAFYQAFPAEQARRLLRRIELHYVPKHASWLNMVEIEIGVLAGQCLDRRIESYPRLIAEVAAWEKQRNGARARIDWSFTTEKAGTKMGRAYPRPTNLNGRKKSKPLCQGTRAFPTQAYSDGYPAWMKKLRQSAGFISSVAMAQALQRPSSVRLASLRKMFLNLAKACSIGSRSGL